MAAPTPYKTGEYPEVTRPNTTKRTCAACGRMTPCRPSAFWYKPFFCEKCIDEKTR